MRYIKKNYGTEAVRLHEEELKRLQLDKNSLIDHNVYPNRTGTQLYDRVRDMGTLPNLKKQMYDEQGGVCCYCGMKLEYPFDPQYRVEHVLPKEKHRELVGEYENLLLSCKANSEEVQQRNEAINKKQRKKLIHCDEAKGSDEITYSPLNKSCEDVFKYQMNGGIEGKDTDAEKDIVTLGLNGPYLTNRRKNAIESIFIGEDVLSEEDLKVFKDGLQRKNNGKYAEFYFVLIDVINQLLPEGR